MNDTHIRSSLNLSNTVDTSFMKRQAWRDNNVLIVKVDDPMLNLGWEDKELLRNIGDRLYGKGKPIGR